MAILGWLGPCSWSIDAAETSSAPCVRCDARRSLTFKSPVLCPVCDMMPGAHDPGNGINLRPLAAFSSTPADLPCCLAAGALKSSKLSIIPRPLAGTVWFDITSHITPQVCLALQQLGLQALT